MSFARQCPCCGYLTLTRRAAFEICEVCFWQDDGQDDMDAEIMRGGPNAEMTLAEARGNFLLYGACAENALAHVRTPRETERKI